MTLDEAIKHAREVAEDKRADADWKFRHGRLNADDCISCAEEAQQLAEWLEELQELRNITAGHLYAVAFNRGYLKAEKEVREKAIDDFVNQFNVIVDEKCGTDTNNYFRKIVKEVAEQLKESETE